MCSPCNFIVRKIRKISYYHAASHIQGSCVEITKFCSQKSDDHTSGNKVIRDNPFYNKTRSQYSGFSRVVPSAQRGFIWQQQHDQLATN